MATVPKALPQARPLSLWLIGAYIVALMAFPADFGPRVGGVVLSASRLVLLAAIVVALVDWRVHLSAARTLPRVVWLGWLAFLASALVTAALFPSIASWARYGSLILEGPVVVLLVYRVALAPGGLRMLVAVTVGATVVVAGMVLALAAGGQRYDLILSDIAGTEPLSAASPRFGLERQAGPFRAALYFGIWMAVASALLLQWMSEGARRVRWIARAAWLLLLVAVFVLTTSRVATTAMFILPGIYYLVRGRRATGAAFLVLAVVVGIAFSFLTLGPDLTTGPGDVLPDSSPLRLDAIRATLEALRINPLFGWGLLTDVRVLSDLIGVTNFVDNAYLSLLVELGIVGSAAFVFLLGVIVLLTRRAWSSAFGLALSIAPICDLAMGVFATTFKASQGYAALFVLAALALAAAALAAVASDARDDLVVRSQTPTTAPQRVSDVPRERRDGDPRARA